MNSMFNLENLALNIATLGPIGRSAFGRFFAPALALPVVFVGRHVYAFSKDLFYIPMLIVILITIYIINFAFENLPIERTEQVSLQLVPGMATAMLHLPFSIKIVAMSFFVFSATNYLFERLLEKFSDDPTEKVRNNDTINLDDEEDIDHSETYALPPNKQKDIYEVLMLPIGSGAITSFLIHTAMFLAKRI